MSGSGTLYVVGTPIGNLEDISFRALKVLNEVDLILAEDTRRTRGLLTHYDIHTRLLSYHKHNEKSMAPKALAWLQEGQNVALVSDAGLPGISDPGEEIIRLAKEDGYKVVVVPGPTAPVLALVASGLPTGQFTFWGFIPRKEKERLQLFHLALSQPQTAIFFEAPTRIGRSLADLASLAGDRPAAVARELTKIHEEVLTGSVAELAERFSQQEVKGEICLVVAGCQPGELVETSPAKPLLSSALLLVAELEGKGFSRKEALRETAKTFGVSRRHIYQMLIREKKNKDARI